MKRKAAFLFVLLMLLSFSSCTRRDNVLRSVGRCESEQVWTHGGFQDYTDFGIYTFSSSVDLSNNRYFSPVKEEDIETIGEYVTYFEGCVETICTMVDPEDELVVNYAFDRAVIDTEDYFYIYEDDNYSEFGNFDLWFFDVQTDTLYFFHDNM